MIKSFKWYFASAGAVLGLVVGLGCGGGAGAGSGTATPGETPVAPAFTSQPASLGVGDGGVATFTVAANGTPSPAFAWQRSDDAGSTWDTLPGAKAGTVELTARATDNLARFRAVATNAAGTATSRAVTLTVGSTIYLAGGWRTPTGQFPCYWLNGGVVNLPLPAGASGGEVDAIALSSGHLYAAGAIFTVSGSTPGYWLDQVWTALPVPPAGSSGGWVRAIGIDTGTVYMVSSYPASTETGVPLNGYWMNGVWVGLPVAPSSQTTGIKVSGGDVYIAGDSGYWLNGVWIEVFDPSLATQPYPLTVLEVSGVDVFLAGNTGYFRNQTWTALSSPDGTNVTGYVTGLAVASSNVYASGSMNSGWYTSPGYWMNGVWHSLNPAPGSTGGYANVITVNGGNQYVAGESGGIHDLWASDKPGYWVNGVWVDLDLPAAGTSGWVGSIVIP